ncbi:hypothetical protein RM780_25425 [Streptomyces sp. DSM 44917]|uniref:Uncharacterized protein n=1 Tax=Streptomyces boetiae TaxID=3075541 RepID=A0ABU2LGI6_9ACTN|nr:hypothetical protein [Streptomyces sp. DSM 44917]MDT0310268.1 hypothetical protein [Streptomyces sp. DSM 44917]
MLLGAFAHSRSPAYLEAQEYLLHTLAREHPAGYRGLPQPARTHAATIGLFFDDLDKLVAHGMIDPRLVIGSHGPGIVRLRDALAPYVHQERNANGLPFWVHFEDLAAPTAATPPTAIHTALRLRQRPPPASPRRTNGSTDGASGR